MTFNFLVLTAFLTEIVKYGIKTAVAPIINFINIPFKKKLPFVVEKPLYVDPFGKIKLTPNTRTLKGQSYYGQGG